MHVLSFFRQVKYMAIQKQRMCQPQRVIVAMFPVKNHERTRVRANGWGKQLPIFFIIRPYKKNMIRPSNIFGPEILENECRVLPNFASKIKKVFPCEYIGMVHKLELFATSQMQYLGFL